MDKKQFCTFLENELRLYLSSKEVYKTLNFFKEIIDDRVDEGLSEEEAVSQLGNIDDIVGQILDEHNIKKRQKKLVWRFIPQKTPSAANIIIAILLFPIWITIFSLSIKIIKKSKEKWLEFQKNVCKSFQKRGIYQ